jgi:hypothetical protein
MNAVVDHLISGTLPVSLILADLKGETADLFLRALGGRLQTASKEQRTKVLERLITIRFFSGETLPEFNLLAPADGADPLTQAYALAETIESTVGAALGSRQVTAFGTLLALAIEQRLTLIELRYLVHDPERVAALAARSKLAEVRHYVATRFTRERGVADGIVTCRASTLSSPIGPHRSAHASSGHRTSTHRIGTGSIRHWRMPSSREASGYRGQNCCDAPSSLRRASFHRTPLSRLTPWEWRRLNRRHRPHRPVNPRGDDAHPLRDRMSSRLRSGRSKETCHE